MPAGDRRAAAAAFFPNLQNGLHAEHRRSSGEFTEWDGFVPSAGRDSDPVSRHTPLSPSRLENYGQCPLSFFFGNILGLKLPEEFKYDPDIWLDPMSRGSILHEVFRDFIAGITDAGECPDPDNPGDTGRILEILERAIENWKRETPPPRKDLEESVRREMRETCRLFLAGQKEFFRLGRPKFLEAAAGYRASDSVSPLDSDRPVEMITAPGRSIGLRGRVDRVDELHGSGGKGFAVWDYKTGSASRYTGGKIFDGGRIVQHAVYMHIARVRLREWMKLPVNLQFFGFFFPGVRAEGEFVKYRPEDLAEGGSVIDCLCRSMACGAFPATENNDDCRYCDFSAICGNTTEAVARSSGKMANPANLMLEPLREARKYV